ncbi:MAG TPA: alkaline phosphatase family protein [Phenylobacterium sp.]|jgi:hypothetical protein
MLKRIALAGAVALAASSAHAASIGTVFVIALENHNFTQPAGVLSPQPILGNAAAPFINSLVTPGNPNAAMVSYASNYTNVPPQNGQPIHPSEPNYVWSEAGKSGPLNDAQPFPSNIVSGPSLSASLQAQGTTWRSYQEDTDLATVSGNLTNTVVPLSQYTAPLTNSAGVSPTYTNAYNGSHQFDYAAKHNPQVFFTATNGGNDASPNNPEARFYAPLQQLTTDLANNTVARYNWITPDQFNDMHTALTGGFTYNGTHFTGDAASIAQGDNFLSQLVPQIEASQAFQNNGVIVIWNDETEGDGQSTNGFTSTEIVISPLAKGNAYTNTISYTHSSDLRTWQEVFGVSGGPGEPFIGDAANATDLRDLFQANVIPNGVPEPATWAMMIVGFGGIGALLRRRSGAAVPQFRA